MKRYIFCVILLLSLSAFAITDVQNKANWTGCVGTGTSITCTVKTNSDVSTHNLLAVWTFWQSTSTYTASVGDSPNNKFYSAVGPALQSASNTTAQIFYAKNITGTSPQGYDLVTVTFNSPSGGTISAAGAVVVEYSGLDQTFPLDSASAGHSYGSFLDSGLVRPVNANVVVFGGAATDNGSATLGSGFSLVQSSPGPPFHELTEEAILSNNANTLQHATASLGQTSGNWVMSSAVFRAAYLWPISSQHNKFVIDARDIGVDCTGATDSSAALNALSSPGLTNVDLQFPADVNGTPCTVQLASTWSICGGSNFMVDGLTPSQADYNGTMFNWTGSAGGTMIDVEISKSWVIQNLALNALGVASVGINYDQNTSSCSSGLESTDGIIRNVWIDGHAPSGSVQSNFTGIYISKVSDGNVEMTRILDSGIECRNTPTSGTVGVHIGQSQNGNALEEYILNNAIDDCGAGVEADGGSGYIERNITSGNGVDFTFPYGWGRGGWRVRDNQSESIGNGEKFLTITFSGTTDPIDISGNSIQVNDGCAVDVGGAAVVSSVPNGWILQGGNTVPKVCSSNNSQNFVWTGISGLIWPDDITNVSATGIQAGVFYNGGPVNFLSNYHSWPAIQTYLSYGAILFASPVKWSGTNNQVTGTLRGDAGTPGIVIGVAANKPGTANGNTAVMTAGQIPMQSPGSCSVGQWAVVSTGADYEVDCTSTYTAGTVVGTVMQSETGGGTVYVDVGLR